MATFVFVTTRIPAEYGAFQVNYASIAFVRTLDLGLSGITGAADGESNAHSEVLSALTRDKIRILVINRVEVLSLSDTNDLVTLLREKLLQLTLWKIVKLAGN